MEKENKIGLVIWILTLSAFAIGTAEFVIAGLLTQIAEDLGVSDGKAGYLITAYAIAIVVGGPILTLYLVRFEKKAVLLSLIVLFIIGNLISAFSSNYEMLLISRFVTGLIQGPFYGIGAVVAANIVIKELEGRAIGQMFTGLTLANFIGVPLGSWIGITYNWHVTFIVIAVLGIVAFLAILIKIPNQAQHTSNTSIKDQLSAFKDWNLIASLLITILVWTGFMAFYGYIAPIAEYIALFDRVDISWILVIVGIGLVVGNYLGGLSADKNLKYALIFWSLAFILSLVLIGFLAPYKWLFVLATFIFGIASFSNVPPMQMRVMKYGQKAPELSSTANISAFNIANALGGVIGTIVIDGSLGISMLPFVAIIIPVIGFIFLLSQEYKKK